jgi:MoaA/NifB/PqqE/SkfB family radical SAM enzyme
MCGIWARKKEHEITPSELDGILFDPLWKRVRVVGLNGGEPTLRKDLAALAEVLHNRLPRLRRVSLITNALVADKAISRINELLEISSRHRTELDVMVALDGGGEVHDRVRGRPGNFKKALEVLNHISAIGSPVTARIGCTVIRDNVYGLHDLHEFALEKKIYIKYRLGVPHNRLYNKNHLSPFALNDDERLHFAEFLRHIVTFYEPSERQKFFYRSLIGQFHDGKQRCAGCDWQHRGATLSSRGELLYCAVESPVLGSALDEGASALYFGSKQTLRKILQDACGGCAHDYVGLPSARQYCKEVAAAIASQSSIGLNLNAPKIFAYPARTTRFLQTLRRGRAIKSKEAKKAILLCGWYGTETVGDKAILAGVTEALRGIYGQIPMRVASLDPPLTKVTLKQVPDLQSHEVISI